MFTVDNFYSKKKKWQKIAKAIIAIAMAISLVFWTLGPLIWS